MQDSVDRYHPFIRSMYSVDSEFGKWVLMDEKTEFLLMWSSAAVSSSVGIQFLLRAKQFLGDI